MNILLLIVLLFFVLYNIFPNKENFSNCEFESYFINLDRQKERKDYMEKQFKQNGINVTRYSAIDKKNMDDAFLNDLEEKNIINSAKGIQRQKKVGSLACLLSHNYLWKDLYDKNKNKDKFFLIFEDDCKILPGFNDKLQEAIRNAPEDWDMIWLGYNKIKGEKISDYYFKPKVGFFVGYNCQHHCYLVRTKGIPKLLDIIFPVKSNFNTKDTVLRKNFHKFNAYFYNEKLAVQDLNEFPISERTGRKNG